jgi:KaiC/GvpD/RAD55 family RecA-like ATPase
MFVNASELFWLATTYRVLNIRGHYGSGKTLLAVAMAYELWRKDYVGKIYANFPMAGRELEYIEGDLNFVMIIDETHVVLDARSFSKNASSKWLKDIRKRNSILIAPSMTDVDVRFRKVMVQRSLMIGNLAWLYRWQVDDGMGVHGNWFMIYKPSRYFGAYDTRYSPLDEDFERLERVMSGNVEIKRDETVEGRYMPVQEVGYPVEEPKFDYQVKEPSIRKFFGKGD